MAADSDDDDELPLAVALDDAAADIQPGAGVVGATPDGLPRAPVPVTLITGYLGAGKTTLVRHVLEANHGRRVAVILNEYGDEPGLEPAFVQGPEGARDAVPQWVELANGCLCCSVKAEFVQALEGLLAADSKHAGKFDYVLVETTGLANPGPIMAELWTDEELEAAVVLDGVVAVVDGRNAARQLAEGRPQGRANEATLQVALADVVLLNKMDLLTEAEAAALDRRLRGINAAATVVRSTRGVVDLGLLLDRGAYRLRLLEQQQQQQQEQQQDKQEQDKQQEQQQQQRLPPPAAHPLEWLGEAAAAAAAAEAGGGGSADACCSVPGCSDAAHTHTHGGGCGNLAAPPLLCAAHDAAVTTVSLRVRPPLDEGRFRAWLEELLWDGGDGGGGGASSHDASVSGGGEGGDGTSAEAAAAAASGQHQRPELLRVKGLLRLAGTSSGGNSGDSGNGDGLQAAAAAAPEVARAHLLQAVYDVYDIAPGPTWEALAQQQRQKQQQVQLQQVQAVRASHDDDDDAAQPMTRLVLIGRRLDRAALQAQLEACCC